MTGKNLFHLQVEFYETVKEELSPICQYASNHSVRQNRKEYFQTLYEAKITLFPKPDKDPIYLFIYVLYVYIYMYIWYIYIYIYISQSL